MPPRGATFIISVSRSRPVSSVSSTAGNIRAALTDYCLHTHWHFRNIISHACCLSGIPGVILGQISCTYDVCKDIPGHKLAILQYYS